MSSRTTSEIQTAIRQLSLRAELARREGRVGDAAELEARISGYRGELAKRP